MLRAESFADERGPWVSELVRDARRVETTSPLGRKSFAVLDERGRVVEQGAPGVTATTYEYDDQGRVTRSAQGARAVALRYGADGLVSEVEDALGRVTRVTRDAVGRPTRSEGPPAGRAWEASYDADGQQSSLTPPGREPHTWEYSAVGRLLASVLPAVEGMLASLGWRYDRDGLPLEVTREDGSKSQTEYDMSGRPVRVVSEASDLQFVYKETTGQLERVEEAGGGSIDMEWEGPLLKAIAWAGIVAARMEVEYGSMGLPISQTLEQGPALAFEYDGDALPTRIGELELTWGSELARLESMRAGACERTFGYDEYGMPSLTAEGCGGALWSEALEYDAGGRISASEEVVDGATTRHEYTYDDAGRLAQVRTGGVATRYEYDAHDNRTSRQTGAAQAEVGTHDAQDRLLTYAGRSYNHDGRGRVTGWSQGTQDTTLEWDADDRLAAVTLPSGQRVSYRFDTSGRRAAVDLDGVTQNLFLFNGLQLLAQQDASGQLTQRYVYATHGHVPDLMWRQGEWYRLIKDVRGSVRLVVSIDDGSIAQRLDYDEFGRVLADSSPGFQPFGFAGGIYDHRTQLVLFGFRSYDPLSGRFLSRDPLWHGGGHSNLYLYVANDPVNFVDPDGLWALPLLAPYIPLALEVFAGFNVVAASVALMAPSKDGSYSNYAGKFWGLPNTVIGIGYGVVGTVINSAWYGTGTHWEISNNAISIYNHPIQRGKGSITMGNVICYYDEKVNLTQDHMDHERQHTYQNEKLGQYYFPLHIVSGIISSIFNYNHPHPWHAINPLESGPSNQSKSPWSW